MTPEQQNVAIAEWIGPFVKWEGKVPFVAMSKDAKWEDRIRTIPDCHGDLNEIRKSVFQLPQHDKGRYAQNLEWVVIRFNAGWSTLEAAKKLYLICESSSSQRCKALLMTLGKWPQ